MARVAIWDPFWFMREMFRWGELAFVVPKAAAVTPAPEAKLTLPDQVDADQVKAAPDNGEPTPAVPKAAVTPAPVPAPAKKRRTTGSGRRSAARKPRRGASSPSRRG
jgi:hypothetical protein